MNDHISVSVVIPEPRAFPDQLVDMDQRVLGLPQGLLLREASRGHLTSAALLGK